MPAISQRTLMHNSVDDALNSGASVAINGDLSMAGSPNGRNGPNGGGGTTQRKHSHPPQVLPNGSFLPMGKGIQGSGATLNNPNLKRALNNQTVTIKSGLEVHSAANDTLPDKMSHPRGAHGNETPDGERDSQAHTPPRAENTLTPMNRGSSKKYTTLPKI